jgi:hypothetical protein
MKEVQLTQGYIALVDDSDYELVIQSTWYALVAKRKDGSIRAVYATRSVRTDSGFKTEYLHRFIAGVTDSKTDVDHEDHDGLNCQRFNLRVSTRTQNLQNQRLRPDNTSGFKGVSWRRHCKKYRAAIVVNGEVRFLGYFDEPEPAARAYDDAAIAAFGKYACLNFPRAEGKEETR